MSEPIPLQLPARPSLEQLRKQAKDLLRNCQDGVAAAAERIRRHRPEATEPLLADAQHTLAREYGFESWPQLVHHVDAANSVDLDHLSDIARDLVVAYAGDAEALARLNALQRYRHAAHCGDPALTHAHGTGHGCDR